MLDAGINKISPTTFVNIGLQNGVLLRTVLDPINGQLTDTRTRLVVYEHTFTLINADLQILGNSAYPSHSSGHPAKPWYPGAIVSIVAQLHLPEPYALHPAHF